MDLPDDGGLLRYEPVELLADLRLLVLLDKGEDPRDQHHDDQRKA